MYEHIDELYSEDERTAAYLIFYKLTSTKTSKRQKYDTFRSPLEGLRYYPER